MTDTPARLQRLPTWLINRVALPVNRLVNDRLADVGVRRYHYALLAALEEGGSSSQADLGRRTSIDRSDVVAVLNELVERGLVERAPDPADGRRNVIAITRAGTDYLHELDRVLAAVQDELLAPLSPDERRQLGQLLTRLVRHHDEGTNGHCSG